MVLPVWNSEDKLWTEDLNLGLKYLHVGRGKAIGMDQIAYREY